MSDWRLIHGDALEELRKMEPESVDAVVTDPPYGLAFMGKPWDSFPPKVQIFYHARKAMKPGAHLVAFGGTRTYHRLACAVEDAGFEIRDMLAWMYGMGFPKSLNLDGDWQGWGTALKPAHEPIVLARKPLSGTVAANVQRYGTGAVNVDGCRVVVDPADPVNGAQYHAKPSVAYGSFASKENREIRDMTPKGGRWPPNVLLDDEAAEELDRQSGEGPSGVSGARSKGVGVFDFGEHGFWGGYGDSGGASRFFPRFRYVAKASTGERGDGNAHPTVKPVELMRWLCRLVTPPGGLILDPFAGSGTTVIAALREGFRSIGIEREAEYVEIARRRIEGDAPLFNRNTA